MHRPAYAGRTAPFRHPPRDRQRPWSVRTREKWGDRAVAIGVAGRRGAHGDRLDRLGAQAVERAGQLLDAGEDAVVGHQGQCRDDKARGERRDRGGQGRPPGDGGGRRMAARGGGIDSRARPRAKSVPRMPSSAERAATRRSVPTLRRRPSVSTRCAIATARSRSPAGRPQRRTAASATRAAGLGLRSQWSSAWPQSSRALVQVIHEPRGERRRDHPALAQPQVRSIRRQSPRPPQATSPPHVTRSGGGVRPYQSISHRAEALERTTTAGPRLSHRTGRLADPSTRGPPRSAGRFDPHRRRVPIGLA